MFRSCCLENNFQLLLNTDCLNGKLFKWSQLLVLFEESVKQLKHGALIEKAITGHGLGQFKASHTSCFLCQLRVCGWDMISQLPAPIVMPSPLNIFPLKQIYKHIFIFFLNLLSVMVFYCNNTKLTNINMIFSKM